MVLAETLRLAVPEAHLKGNIGQPGAQLRKQFLERFLHIRPPRTLVGFLPQAKVQTVDTNIVHLHGGTCQEQQP
jgi:hypothetical protein